MEEHFSNQEDASDMKNYLLSQETIYNVKSYTKYLGILMFVLFVLYLMILVFKVN